MEANSPTPSTQPTNDTPPPQSLMSGKQVEFLRTLAVERLGAQAAAAHLDKLRADHPYPTREQASAWIEDLKARKSPKPYTGSTSKPLHPEVKAGRYALPEAGGGLRMYRVDRPDSGRFKGRVFVKEVVDEDHVGPKMNLPANLAEGVLARIAADPKGASVAYGRKTGVCGVCLRRLTDPNSVEAGIGPICAAKLGF